MNGLSLTGFISHILGAEIKSVLSDPERQRRAHHAAETNGREIEFSFTLTLCSVISQHKHTHTHTLPNVDETARGEMDSLRQGL